MFTIDTKSDEKYFIIKKDGKKFCKISKAVNSLEAVKKFYKIEVVE